MKKLILILTLAFIAGCSSSIQLIEDSEIRRDEIRNNTKMAGLPTPTPSPTPEAP